MAIQQTLSIIKPDAVAKNAIGGIISIFEKGGLQIRAARMLRMTETQAGDFYAVHKERPFYGELCDFMRSGPCMVMVLEGEDAIAKNRELMGSTNPAEAAEGTIRKLYATNIERNAVHGSDAPETARTEIAFFFSDEVLVNCAR